MALTYLLAPIPFWVILNNEGTAAGGAQLFTYTSQDKIQLKPVFRDPGGQEQWTNPIKFNFNGVQGPFYWEVDSNDLSDTYYLEAYDANDNLLWTINNYFPPGSGGGGDVTDYISFTNYIANNVFIDSIDATANPINSTNLVIAPSNHQGFTPALINPVVTPYGVVGPDTRFVKNSTTASDQINFPVFPLGDEPFTDDVTPVTSIEYVCTNPANDEVYKSFQFPICQKVQNLSNQIVTFKIWAKVAATPEMINIYTLQYYGSGTGATAPYQMLQGTIALTTTWTPYYISFTIPNVSLGTLGTSGQQTNDDALYIQLGMPLNTPCDIFFTKPALYLGNIEPSLDFQTYDQINSIDSTFRTGDIKTSLSSQAPLGWVPMNDGSIGNVGSGATTRANQDTFQLYKTIWDGVSNLWAPTSNPGGRGATAIADFIAGYTLTLPLSLGRALSGAGTGAGLPTYSLGQNAGALNNSVILVAANIPQHTHHTTVPVFKSGAGSGFAYANGTAPTNVVYTSDGGASLSNIPLTTPPTAFTVPSVTPSSFMNVFIKL